MSTQPTTPPVSGAPFIDPFGRRITYVRISVTDRCNLRCTYCMPHSGPEWMERGHVLAYEEIARLVRIMARHGVRKVRLTGGEPLARRDLTDLVAMLADVPGIATLAMTTNATMLERHARDLRAAGMQRLNISLDTLRRERFADITEFDMFDAVWRGIEAADAAGFEGTKLNAVLMRGVNDDELADFADLTLRRDLTVRFIEYMPIGGERDDWSRNKVVPAAEALAALRAQFDLEPVDVPPETAGPEALWRIRGAAGRIGFITPVSDEFCARCNRVRVTSDGKLRGCLMRDSETDLRAALRGGASDGDLEEILFAAIARKPEKHLINDGNFEYSTFYTMNRLGG